MVVALGYLEIGAQHSHVHRRRYLTNTAAQSVYLRAVGEDNRGAVSSRCGSLTDNIVVREFFARIQNGSVNRIARQTNVGSTACLTAVVIRRGRAQYITEQQRL